MTEIEKLQKQLTAAQESMATETPLTMDDYQQAAIQAGAKALADDWNPERDPVLTAMFSDYSATALTAATPHLRAAWEAELLGEGVLGAGYSVLMNPKAGEHPVATFTRAVRHMLALLKGGGE